MSKHTLYDKVWDAHKVATLPSGLDQIFIGLHLIHEVTSPQAFAALEESNSPLAFPDQTIATMDHIVPTDRVQRPYLDSQAELMAETLGQNTTNHRVTFYDKSTGKQGIVHVLGPEMGLTQPGMTIACGDSHTSTHGAFGSLAFGIGTTQVRNVFETQTLSLSRLKVRRIKVTGSLSVAVSAKDVALKIMAELGVKGGIGYAYEYAGSVFDAMNMEERMTVCNMSIEGGARIGYVNPDQTTFDYIRGRDYAPKAEAFDRAVAYWKSVASDEDAIYDDEFEIDGSAIAPMLTWGVTPGQAIAVDEKLPDLAALSGADLALAEQAFKHMQLTPNTSLIGTKIHVGFIGSCTNSRISDLRAAAEIYKGHKVAKGLKVLVVPGSQQVKAQAEAEGLHEIFIAAGAQWREPGCSMCLGMNPDKLVGDQLCASSSNRNFIGRQGSPNGRTLLMSPAMVAAATIAGEVVDLRSWQ